MNDTRTFQHGMVAGMLLMLGADGVNWFITTPESSNLRTVLAGLQVVICFAGAAWLVLRQRRARSASHA